LILIIHTEHIYAILTGESPRPTLSIIHFLLVMKAPLQWCVIAILTSYEKV